ncbi:MAG: NADH-quinone oxidoreductase subunit K [Candidatus Omnitrophota bacterium]|nr:NADH-quinone oxidoreductase subunit K [Candidatus Omnitrophota bacterium]
MANAITVILLFIIGIYCILVSHNLIRVLIGLEILIKAVTLLVIFCGYQTQNTALAQALVITIIVIEVVMMTVAAGVVVGIHRQNNSLDARNIRKLKG